MHYLAATANQDYAAATTANQGYVAVTSVVCTVLYAHVMYMNSYKGVDCMKSL